MYVINPNLVVNLNDSTNQPVKRENSNQTHITGVTTSTAVTGASNVVQQLRNHAFYQTQQKFGKGFFQNKPDPN